MPADALECRYLGADNSPGTAGEVNTVSIDGSEPLPAWW